jgi:hypothetical protein
MADWVIRMPFKCNMQPHKYHGTGGSSVGATLVTGFQGCTSIMEVLEATLSFLWFNDYLFGQERFHLFENKVCREFGIKPIEKIHKSGIRPHQNPVAILLNPIHNNLCRLRRR